MSTQGYMYEKETGLFVVDVVDWNKEQPEDDKFGITDKKPVEGSFIHKFINDEWTEGDPDAKAKRKAIDKKLAARKKLKDSYRCCK